MTRNSYITVILPLRLTWTPYYSVDVSVLESSGVSEIKRGDRVRVMFANREYVGVVCDANATTEIVPTKIKPVLSVEKLSRISEQELSLWEFISDYYMCTMGEVYLAAYPLSKLKGEILAQRIREKTRLRIEKKQESLNLRKLRVRERIEKKKEKLQALNPSKSSHIDKILLYNSQIEALSGELFSIDDAIAALSDPTSTDCGTAAPLRLSKAQKEAKDKISECFDDNKIALLNGVTGSGKTEIYIELAKETLSGGKNVLLLVPEIAMTYQLECRIRKLTGNVLLTFNSAESLANRRETARKMMEAPYLLLGTRSSIFLPHHNLGLIIVDEEHDASYKQDSQSPRYNGRDCAVMLGAIHRCNVLLGSATPSLESLYNCRNGRYGCVELSQRYYSDLNLKIELIDAIAERKKRGMVGSISRKLITHINETLADSSQVLLLRARKSYSPYLQCGGCGTIPKCPHCNVSLSYHKDRNSLVCHHCGYKAPYNAVCDRCGDKLILMGAGTQKIEEEIATLFPQAKVARMDRDNMNSWPKIVDDFAERRIDILVGTQIVAKGFDFGNISLVAVIQADALLGQQDFRSDEKAFQLMRQLSGRGGRRDGKCRLVIQSSQPAHPVYASLSGPGSFIETEFSMRRQFCYPPFTRMIRLVMKDANLPRLEKLSASLVDAIARAFGISPAPVNADNSSQVQISYSCPPFVDKLNDDYLRHSTVTLRRDKTLAGNKRRLAEAITRFERQYAWNGHIAIDVDPI